jgi:hypothetical protein
MGQYHKLVNIDKQEVVYPDGIGLFSKQYEHTGIEGSLADAIYLLVMSSPDSGGGDWPGTVVSGRWCGDRVVVLGDYTQEGSIRGYEGDASKLYGESKDWLDISGLVREGFTKVFPITYKLEQKTLGGEPYTDISRIAVGTW